MSEIQQRKSRPPMSKEMQLRVFRRDKWVCRWCNRPVIFAPVMKFLEREIIESGRSEPLSYYHAHWTHDGAPLLDELGAVIDHVEAFSTGGASTEENLATACCKCNGQKRAAPMAEFSKRPQRKPIKGKYGEPQYWDGLASVFVILARKNQALLSPSFRAAMAQGFNRCNLTRSSANRVKNLMAVTVAARPSLRASHRVARHELRKMRARFLPGSVFLPSFCRP